MQVDLTEPLRANPLPWLLDSALPGVRYLALRDLLDLEPDGPELLSARAVAHCQGPISDILAEMQEPGFWCKPGAGYNPKYRSTVWSVLTLAQLGASVAQDERIGRACSYLLDHALAEQGQFGTMGTPGSTVDCLQGNLSWSLLELGCDDPRLESAFDWMARTVTGEGLGPAGERDAPLRYYAAKCGPLFACGANDKQPCAWGATKVMLAFGRLPRERWTPLVRLAVERGAEYLLSVDPATAAYPSPWASRPSGNWWKFGFPLLYITDLLQLTEALVAVGYGRDPRLARTLNLIRCKQDALGRWALEYDYSGKIWADFGDRKQPSPWVTLRALRVLKRAEVI